MNKITYYHNIKVFIKDILLYRREYLFLSYLSQGHV